MNGRSLLLVFSGLWSGISMATPILHTSDFIDDASRSHFNSFEKIPNDGLLYTGGSGPYIEDGIRVEQINGDSGNNIMISYDPGGRDGRYAWYPIGGDRGFTSISLASGMDFDDVGFLIGSGHNPVSLAHYELWNDGALVMSGSVSHQTSFHYLGFEGGGFDTIRLWDSTGVNALTLDAIETRTKSATVPEPTVFSLLGLGLLGLGVTQYNRKN